MTTFLFGLACFVTGIMFREIFEMIIENSKTMYHYAKKYHNYHNG